MEKLTAANELTDELEDLSAEDRAKLNGHVTSVVEKNNFDGDSFLVEVRRAMSGRELAS